MKIFLTIVVIAFVCNISSAYIDGSEDEEYIQILDSDQETSDEHPDEFIFGNILKSKKCIACEHIVKVALKKTESFEYSELAKIIHNYGCSDILSHVDRDTCMMFIREHSAMNIAANIKEFRNPVKACKAMRC